MLLQTIADYAVSEQTSKLKPEVIHHAKRAVIDWYASLLPGSRVPPVTLLEQAVSNVVYNAVRYNRAGGHVAVLLEAAEPAGVRIRVLDDGPGVPPERLARLRERGYRADEARTRNPDGQGLGLHITQRVVDAHGMTLDLHETQGGGLTVDITSG